MFGLLCKKEKFPLPFLVVSTGSPLDAVELIRNFGLDCIEEQYNQCPIIRAEQIHMFGKTYSSVLLAQNATYCIIKNSDNVLTIVRY